MNKYSILEFLNRYVSMDLGYGIKIPCPYWMNKLVDDKVAVRGEFNGKGTSEEIREALIQVLKREDVTTITAQSIQKIAKRYRIGIDCSGLVYRILEYLVNTKQIGSVSRLEDVFLGGINRTNADMLTNINVSRTIDQVKDVEVLDLIRIRGGKHVLIVMEKTSEYIQYLHSSHETQIQGVHFGIIRITSPVNGLENQSWLEKAKDGMSFGNKYYLPERGDSIRRLQFIDGY